MNKMILFLVMSLLLVSSVFALAETQEKPTQYIIDGENKPFDEIGNRDMSTNITQNMLQIHEIYGNKTGVSMEFKSMEFNGEDKQVMQVQEMKQIKLFGLFNKNMPVETIFDAANGEVLQVKNKWYYFLAFGRE